MGLDLTMVEVGMAVIEAFTVSLL